MNLPYKLPLNMFQEGVNILLSFLFITFNPVIDDIDHFYMSRPFKT